MKIEATTAEMLAVCCMHIAIADNMSSQHFPAKDSTCHSCQKIGHWKQKCRKSNKAKDAHKKPKSQPQQ